MTFSRRGAARVSIVWIITVGVLFLVSMVFAYISQSDLAAAENRVEIANADRDKAIAGADVQAGTRRSISEAVGFFDAESADPSANPETIAASLSTLRATFGLDEATSKTFEKAVPLVTAAYEARGREITTLKSQVESLTGELDSTKSQMNQVKRDKDAEIASIRQEKSDEAASAASRLDDLERRVAQLGGQNSELDLELRNERESRTEDARSNQQLLSEKAARIDELARLAAFAKHDRAKQADGKILAVSSSQPIAFIDRGAKDRLALGTRFRIESGTLGSRKYKATGEVVKIENSKATIEISDLQDEFNPVVPGDVIVNPLYDPEGERNAVLVGRFDATYSEKELRLLLADIGINVQPKLDATTHYLIVGSEVWVDEDGEPLEEPLQPSDLPVYSEAEADGVQIVPLQNVREFFTLKRES